VKTTKADLDLCPLFLDRMHRDPEIRPQVRPHFARWVSCWQATGAAPQRKPPSGVWRTGAPTGTAGFLHRWPMENKTGRRSWWTPSLCWPLVRTVDSHSN